MFIFHFYLLGTLCNVEEALNVGLVDRVVEPDKLESAAEEEMNKMLNIPG